MDFHDLGVYDYLHHADLPSFFFNYHLIKHPEKHYNSHAPKILKSPIYGKILSSLNFVSFRTLTLIKPHDLDL